MNYKDFKDYTKLINYIKPLNIESEYKKDLFYLIDKLCDKVKETCYDNGYYNGYDVGYNIRYVDGYDDDEDE